MGCGERQELFFRYAHDRHSRRQPVAAPLLPWHGTRSCRLFPAFRGNELDYTLPFPRSFDRHALNVLPLRRGFDAAREAPFTGGALFKRPCASVYSTVNAFIVCEESYINGMCCQEKYFIYGIYLKKVWKNGHFG